jgi:hypothetical protein
MIYVTSKCFNAQIHHSKYLVQKTMKFIVWQKQDIAATDTLQLLLTLLLLLSGGCCGVLDNVETIQVQCTAVHPLACYLLLLI